MPLSIGVNLRVTGHCNQGGRKYMEDMFSVAYQQTPDDKDLEYAFFGIFDGHGGGEAATFAKEHLMDIIVKQKNFWSDKDEDVLRAIRDGYVNTHYAMWRELDKWPRTASGLPSTAGTTASIAFIRKGKIYIGHVGDSGIILGYQSGGDPQWKAKALTKDHKPESGPEMVRIKESGGKVVSKSGVPRVVWNRPRIGHKGPVRRSTHIDEIPFLAVARSLGDLWSYNSELDTFVVSPEPDVKVVAVDVKSHRCLIFGTDGLWNMLTPQAAVAIVQAAERHNEKHLIASQQTGTGQSDVQMWINPSKSLVDRALERWSLTRLRADNTSVVTLMLDPPGPSKGEFLLNQKKEVVSTPPKSVSIHTKPVNTEIQSTDPLENSESSEKFTNCAQPNTPDPLSKTNFKVSYLYEKYDQKQPDSSNKVEEKVNNKENLETKHCFEEKFDQKTNECPNMVTNAQIHNENNSEEGIQVAEISSSDILEDILDIDNKDQSEDTEGKTNNSACDTKEQLASKKNEENTAIEVVQEVPKLEKVNEPQNSPDESKLFNLVRQNAFLGNCEDMKPQFTHRLRRSTGIIQRNSSFNENEFGRNTFPPMRHKQHSMFNNPRNVTTSLRAVTRRHSGNLQSHNTLINNGQSDSKSYLNTSSRFKSRPSKPTLTGNTAEGLCNMNNSESNAAAKRRHSSISQTGPETCSLQEPCLKRRTRSEDRRNPTDENDPANKTVREPSSRLSWPTTESTLSKSGSSTDRLSSPNIFQRRSLGKKATPVKSIRRNSINGSNRIHQLRGSFGLRDWEQGKNNRSNPCSDRRPNRTLSIVGSADSSTTPQRWLRSDTMAATSVKTLRSRNVDITGHTISPQLVHQYGVVKQSRMSLPTKIKQPANSGNLSTNKIRSSSLSSSKIKQSPNSSSGSTGSCSAVSSITGTSATVTGIAKRVKSPYTPGARSLSTRSRIKRLGK